MKLAVSFMAIAAVIPLVETAQAQFPSSMGARMSAMRSSMSSRYSAARGAAISRVPSSISAVPSARFRSPSASFSTGIRYPSYGVLPSSYYSARPRLGYVPYPTVLYGGLGLNYRVGASVPYRYGSSIRYSTVPKSYGSISLYSTPSYRLSYRTPYSSATITTDPNAADMETYRQQQAFVEQRRQELMRPSAEMPATGSNRLPAPLQLADGLRQLENGDVWLEYLKPVAIDDAMRSGGDAKLFAELAPAYAGVSANPDLKSIAAIKGFTETRALLDAYSNAGMGIPASDNAVSDRGVIPSPTPVQVPQSAIESGTESILESGNAAEGLPEAEILPAPEPVKEGEL